MTTYTVEFGAYDILACVSGGSAEVEPNVELLGCTRYGRAVELSTLNHEDVINRVLWHHDMMQQEPEDYFPEPFVLPDGF